MGETQPACNDVPYLDMVDKTLIWLKDSVREACEVVNAVKERARKLVEALPYVCRASREMGSLELQVFHVEGGGVPGALGAMVGNAGMVTRELPGSDPGGKVAEAKGGPAAVESGED